MKYDRESVTLVGSDNTACCKSRGRRLREVEVEEVTGEDTRERKEWGLIMLLLILLLILGRR